MGGHDEVTLTAQERQALSEIERELLELRPRLGRRGSVPGSRWEPGRASRRSRITVAVLGCVVGAVLALATFSRSPVLGFAGLLVMAGALLVACHGLDAPRSAPASPDAATTPRPAWSRLRRP